jgi:vanillate/3-O-methylgallate O-demethylase
MTDLTIKGPDVIRLLSDDSASTPSRTSRRQGQAVRRVQLRRLRDRRRDPLLPRREPRARLVGRPSAHNWVQYHAETGGYDVTIERDERTAVNPKGPRKLYRFQVQGPTALEVLEKANGGPLPEIKFFNMGGSRSPATRCARCITACPGVPGWSSSARGRRARTFGRARRGRRRVRAAPGRLARLRDQHARVGLDPVPAAGHLHRRRLKAYREWLPAKGYEATGSLGGSYYSDDIADYYLTPWDLGYGGFVKFDHDFVGREALEQMRRSPRGAR